MAIITSVTKIICSDTLAAFFRPIYENHVFREEFHYGLGILKYESIGWALKIHFLLRWDFNCKVFTKDSLDCPLVERFGISY